MADQKQTREFTLLNKYGLHVRPAGLFAKISSRYDADVTVEKGKAKGGMTRTLYTGGIATMMAKSRTVQGCAFEVPNWDENNEAIFDWSQIIH